MAPSISSGSKQPSVHIPQPTRLSTAGSFSQLNCNNPKEIITHNY